MLLADGVLLICKVHHFYGKYNLSVHDFRLLPQRKLHLCSSGCYAALIGHSKLTFWALQPVLKHLLLTTNQCCITFQNCKDLKFVFIYQTECDAFQYGSTWPDAKKDVNFRSLASADKQLATAGVSSLDILCDNHAADRSSRVDEEGGEECGLEPMMSFADACVDYENVTTFF